MKHVTPPPDLSIRPVFRILASAFLLFFAYFIARDGINSFSASNVAPAKCSNGRILGEIVCKSANAFLNALPQSVQGQVNGFSGITISIALVFFVILLLKPIFIGKATK